MRHSSSIFLLVMASVLLATDTNVAFAEDSAPALHSEYIMQLAIELDSAQAVGETPMGGRRIVYIKGGSFSGPRIKGVVLPGGGDWVLVRRDGASLLDVRLSLRSDDGTVIYVTYRGISDIPAEVRQRIMKGEDVNPSEYYFRTTPMFETSGDKYAWLNKLVCVGVGRRTSTSVIYDVFAIK